MSTPEIDVHRLAEMRKKNEPHILLDVRERDELATAAVDGALHISSKEIAHRIHEIAADVPVVVMCHHGGRSGRVTQYLQQHGRTNAVNLQGGIDDWAVKIDATVPRY